MFYTGCKFCKMVQFAVLWIQASSMILCNFVSDKGANEINNEKQH